ncbi:NUDIX domain-containing protein [candidate division WWE3 bacterium]|nr:NUDIX domain-containing protein [candidate division WWE3 bacterium]
MHFKTMKEETYHLGIKALIRNSKGEILLLKVNLEKLSNHSLGAYWDIPGGRVQKGCTIEETLKREVEEETGITEIKSFTKLDMVVSNIRIPQGTDTIGLILGIYLCELKKNPNIMLSEEHVEFSWFTPNEASELLKVKYPAEFTKKIANL